MLGFNDIYTPTVYVYSRGVQCNAYVLGFNDDIYYNMYYMYYAITCTICITAPSAS